MRYYFNNRLFVAIETNIPFDFDLYPVINLRKRQKHIEIYSIENMKYDDIPMKSIEKVQYLTH